MQPVRFTIPVMTSMHTAINQHEAETTNFHELLNPNSWFTCGAAHSSRISSLIFDLWISLDKHHSFQPGRIKQTEKKTSNNPCQSDTKVAATASRPFKCSTWMAPWRRSPTDFVRGKSRLTISTKISLKSPFSFPQSFVLISCCLNEI